MNNKNKIAIILVLVGLVIISLLLVCTKVMFKKANNAEKKDETLKYGKVIKDDNISAVRVIEKVEYDDSDVYGFAFHKEDGVSVLTALKPTGSDIELLRVPGTAGMYITDNKLFINNKYYYSAEVDSELYYIDLSSHPYNVKPLAKGLMIGRYMDISDKYLFGITEDDNKRGFKRYEFDTNEVVLFEEETWPHELFLLNNKVYYRYFDVNERARKSITINYDGSERKEIADEEFETAMKEKKITEMINTVTGDYLIKNNKKVYVSEDMKQIIFDGKVIYEAKDPIRRVDLEYSSDENTIRFSDLIYNAQDDPDLIMYSYNISTGTIDRINNLSDDDSYFKEIIIE